MRKFKKGFTLIEIAVATAVFMIFVTIVMRSFIHLLGVQIEANRYRKLYSELNEVMTLISTDVREFAIDYECFEDPVCSRDIYKGQVVAFIRPDLLERRIIRSEEKEDEDGLTYYEIGYAIQERDRRQDNWDTAPTFQPVLTQNTVFTDLHFGVQPLEDPYSNDIEISADNLYQPSMTIFAEAKAKQYLGRQGVIMQTVVSSRQYNVSSDSR